MRVHKFNSVLNLNCFVSFVYIRYSFAYNNNQILCLWIGRKIGILLHAYSKMAGDVVSHGGGGGGGVHALHHLSN